MSYNRLPDTLPYYKNEPIHSSDDPWQVAYTICREHETSSTNDKDRKRSCILGFLIREAPFNDSRDVICQEIKDCGGNAHKFQELSDLYERSFLRVFYSYAKPARSSLQHHPCRSSFDDLRVSLRNSLEKTPAITKKRKALVHERDSRRCVVTSTYSADESGPAGSSATNPKRVAPLEVAHILPQSITQNIHTENKTNYATEVLAVMKRFGRVAPEELQGKGLHRLENLLTLDMGIHKLFDTLKLWLEPTEEDPYTCKVHTRLTPRRELTGIPKSGVITLTTTNPNLPRPNPDYLRLHAACARVCYLSAAAEDFDDTDEEEEEEEEEEEDGAGVLASDGKRDTTTTEAQGHAGVRSDEVLPRPDGGRDITTEVQRHYASRSEEVLPRPDGGRDITTEAQGHYASRSEEALPRPRRRVRVWIDKLRQALPRIGGRVNGR